MPTVDRDGVSIYYETHGLAGDPVLLLMGLGVDAHGWELQVPAFAARHGALLVDNRGVGRSSKPPGPYSTAAMADDAAAVLDALGVARAHVVGLSMGGMIAQELALRHADRVGALVLAATFARPGDEVRDTVARGAEATGGGGLAALAGAVGAVDVSRVDVRDVMRFLMPLLFSTEFLREKREWLQAFFLRSLAYGFSLDAFVAQLRAVLAHDAAARLDAVRAPTLVLAAAADRLVPARFTDELARLVPGARHAILDGTHGFNFESPDAFNAAVLDFLAAHPLG